MMSNRSARAIADATFALTQERDVTDALARIVRDCGDVLDAASIGILVQVGASDLELLSSTSHRVAELEIFQIQYEAGPCVEAIRTSSSIEANGAEEIISRWPGVGSAIVEAGYRAVMAYPMRWRGQTLGAMNIFRTEPQRVLSDDALLAQAFADIATLLIVHNGDVSVQQVAAQLNEVLQARTTIEQAKGVLAYDLDMGAAYDLLGTMVGSDSTLTATAAQVIARAQERADPPG